MTALILFAVIIAMLRSMLPENQIVGVMKAFYRDGKYFDCEKSRKYKVYVVLNRMKLPDKIFLEF